MYTLVPFRRTLNTFPTLFNDHFMREFFDDATMPDMRVDVREREDAYLLEAELPGVGKDQISLSAEDGVLTISADVNSQKKDQKDGYVCSERRSGHVERRFNLEGVDESAIKADYENGVLMVILPKQKAEEKKATRIEIGDHVERLSEGK